mgnify:CR=1 FL=1
MNNCEEMKIELGNKEAYIDFTCFPHILMNGSCATGKTYTILNIVAQMCDKDRNTKVIYLSDDLSDFKKVEYLCDGSLINKTHVMSEDSLISLLHAIYQQNEFRVNLLHDTGCCRLSEVNSTVDCYYINNKKYMPDEIVSYFVDNEERFMLARDSHYLTGITVRTKETKYLPTRTCIIIDCLDISSYSENFDKEYWNSLEVVCKLGRCCWQSLILSSRHAFYENMPCDIMVNIPIRIMFDGDRKTQYRMFGKEVSFVKDKFLIDICGSFGTVSIW